MATTDITNQSIESTNPDSRIIIERMQESDLEQVLNIEHESFSMPWTRNMFETELRESTLSYPIIARWLGDLNVNEIKLENSQSIKPICGYCVFWHVVDEIHIGNLAVAQEFRRKGIAAALIKNIVSLGRQWQIKRITLEVRQSNESAVLLYHRFGFREIAIRKKYYSHPTEDALVMVKDDF